MFPIWVIFFLLLAFLIFRHFDGRQNYWAMKGVPGPKSTFLIGHYWKMRMPNKQTILQLKKWSRQFGKFYGIFDGPKNILVISDLQMVHELLAIKFDLFEARKLNTAANTLSRYNLGSILHATSFRWKRLRNIAAKFFNGINIKKTIPSIKMVTMKALEMVEGEIKMGDGCIDIRPYLQNISDDILVLLIFGDSNAKGQPYFEAMCKAIEAKKRPIAKLFSLISTIFPCSKSALNWLNSRMASNHSFNNRLFECLAKRVEKERKKTQKGNGKMGAENFTFLEHLMTADLEEEDEGENRNGFIYSGRNVHRYLLINEIASACINFLYAGHKTLARALISVFFCLASNGNVQQKLFEEEIAQIEEISIDSLDRLPFLDAVIREALRLFPLGSEHVARKCMVKSTLGEGKIQIEEGDFVMVDVLSLHLDPELWGQNSEQFDPSRWLNASMMRNSSQYLSFGQGPRMCLGEKLAILQLKMVVILWMKRFRIVAENEWQNGGNGNEELMHQKLNVRIMPR